MEEKTLKKIKQTDLDSLGDELAACFKEARRVLANKCFSKKQATDLAKYLEVIRMLLQELEYVTYSFINSGDQAATISELRSNFFELEGSVKELRNDLSGPCCTK